MVRFSIIIPVYNAEKCIIACLTMIERQTFHDFELMVVNDGSKDKSLNVIDDFVRCHPAMKINVISKKNAGAGAARNTGIEAAKGEFIVFIDADDYVDNDFLQRIDEVIRKENADVVFVDIVREDNRGQIIRYERMSDFKGLSKERMIRWQLTGKMPWGGVRKIVKASLVKDNNLRYATHIKVGEESIYSFRVLELADKIAFQTSSLYHYVDNIDSLTSNDNVENSLSVFEYMTGFLQDYGKYDEYATTIRSMAVTTVAIASNVVFNNNSFLRGYGEVRDILRRYHHMMVGTIDKDALDSRVKILVPFLKMGFVTPIWIANKLQNFYKRIIRQERV